ncbi:hypothetical protein ASPWEDRAFT_56824 [Aspergillus wentii DTO 134E9]|uniref:Fe2OG dioxygenase domain-containing protein n=1 Tax=Aspergillus wentii DTO 134E9 TaxID=1073089 RepID=A0A1L9S3U0_ASPWE|nr:uncharacterized protein ASPWEDRAFT_56824 [Aspergillus wentii DTO 134E9]OJJ41828.1 hypothetical protein ASPWEDRAFT_56824 [Aspergillus wentii DTO 134E9]
MTQVTAQPGQAEASSSTSLKKYIHVPETKHELNWADLVTLDLSQFDLPGGKEKLAAQLKDAVHRIGFFYITNFGLTQDEIDRQFAIGKELLELPEDEKLKHRADLEAGSYNGYRPLGSIEILPGRRDNIEMYNVFKFVPQYERTHPDVIHRHRDEIERFHRFIHEGIVYRLLRLIAIILELPEDFLIPGHSYEGNSDCHLRYMIYRARSAEENAKFENLYSRGHTDFGSLTLLFRQPVAALQVKTPEGEWKYVKPHPGSITVNIADALQFWTNGYLKSSVHRVIAPPKDQAHIDRLGVLYFVRPGDELDLKTVESPLLEREGFAGEEEEKSIKAGDWVRARVRKNWEKPPADRKENLVVGGVQTRIFHE